MIDIIFKTTVERIYKTFASRSAEDFALVQNKFKTALYEHLEEADLIHREQWHQVGDAAEQLRLFVERENQNSNSNSLVLQEMEKLASYLENRSETLADIISEKSR